MRVSHVHRPPPVVTHYSESIERQRDFYSIRLDIDSSIYRASARLRFNFELIEFYSNQPAFWRWSFWWYHCVKIDGFFVPWGCVAEEKRSDSGAFLLKWIFLLKKICKGFDWGGFGGNFRGCRSLGRAPGGSREELIVKIMFWMV